MMILFGEWVLDILKKTEQETNLTVPSRLLVA